MTDINQHLRHWLYIPSILDRKRTSMILLSVSFWNVSTNFCIEQFSSYLTLTISSSFVSDLYSKSYPLWWDGYAESSAAAGANVWLWELCIFWNKCLKTLSLSSHVKCEMSTLGPPNNLTGTCFRHCIMFTGVSSTLFFDVGTSWLVVFPVGSNWGLVLQRIKGEGGEAPLLAVANRWELFVDRLLIGRAILVTWIVPRDGMLLTGAFLEFFFEFWICSITWCKDSIRKLSTSPRSFSTCCASCLTFLSSWILVCANRFNV